MTDSPDESPTGDFDYIDGGQFERAWELRFASVLTQRAPLTRWLVLSIFVVFALIHIVALPLHVGAWSPTGSEFFFVLMIVGAKVNALIDAGEIWRLFAAIWLHASLLHLFFNTMALHYLGRMVENSLGAMAFMIVFLASGLMGSVCSYWFSDEPSVGASGAVFGLLGASASYGVANRKHIPKKLKRFLVGSPVLWIVLNLGISLVIPNIDMAAHSGGLVFGALLAPLLGDRILVKPPLLPKRVQKLLCGILISGALIGFGFMIPRLLGQAPGISSDLKQEKIGGTIFFVPAGWRKGTLSHGRCVMDEGEEGNGVGESATTEVCFEDPYQAVLFVYPINLLDSGAQSELLGEFGSSPTGFLRLTDKNDVPVFRRKQTSDEAFSLFVAPARHQHTFVVRAWSNLSSAYLPLLRALVQNNFHARGIE